MSKHKKHRRASIQKRSPHPPGQPASKARPSQARQLTPEELVQEGLRAFKAGRYTEAIRAWEKIDRLPATDTENHPAPHSPLRGSGTALAAALAEAYFRQASQGGPGASSLLDMERASSLVPADPTYAYYLGLALHKTGRVAEAMEAYRRAAAHGLSRRGAGAVIALAALELDPHTDLASVPGVSPQDRQALEPVTNLLHGKPKTQPPAPVLAKTAEHLKGTRPSAWQAVLDGLALLADGQLADARQALIDIQGKTLSRGVNAVRWYYFGLAAARAGDTVAAIEAWNQAYTLDPNLTGLYDNLSALHAHQAAAAAEAGDWPAAAQSALEGLQLLPADATLSNLALPALDRAAQAAFQSGDWAAAGRLWGEARQVLSNLSGGGSPRPIVHNLALAYEAMGQWENAAEAWRAMLRSRPRKKAVEGFGNEHWTWVRQRVVECYKQAGRPDEAIAIFRQALKANPDDADMQLDMAEALLANGQQQAAANELSRLLDKHPQHIGGLTRLADIHAGSQDWQTAQTLIHRALDIEPDNQDLQCHMASVLNARGSQAMEWRQPAQARAMFENALKYAPDDYNIYFNLARVAFTTRQPELARRHIERALELGQDKADAYEQACICWIIENKLNEARAILVRGEASAKLRPDFYIHAGIECIEQASPPPDALDPFSLILGRPSHKPARRKESPPNEMQAFGQTLLERAIDMGPEVDVLRHILGEMAVTQPHEAVPYARRMTQSTPEDPTAWAMLGVVLGLDQQGKQAQAAMKQGERLARQQGNHALAGELKAMGREVANPFFATMARMGPFMDNVDFDDFDDFDFD